MVRKHHQQPGNMSFLVMNTILFSTLLWSVGCDTIRFEVNGYTITFDLDTFSQFFSCLHTTSYQCNVAYVPHSPKDTDLIVSNTTVISLASQQINDSLYFKCPAPTPSGTQNTVCTRSMLDASLKGLDPSTCNHITYQINNDTVYTFGIVFYNLPQNLNYSITHTLSVKIQPCFSQKFNASSQVDQTSDDALSIPIYTNSLITATDPFLLLSNPTSIPNDETTNYWSPSMTSATLGYVTWTTYYDSSASVGAVSEISSSQIRNEITASTNDDTRETLTFITTSTYVIDAASHAMMTEMDIESSDVQSSPAEDSSVGWSSASLVTNDEIFVSSREIESTLGIDFSSGITQGTLVTTPKTFTSLHSSDTLTIFSSLESTFLPTHTALATLEDNNIDTSILFSSSASTFVPTPPLYTTPYSIDTTVKSLISPVLPTSSADTISDSIETPFSSLTSSLFSTHSAYTTIALDETPLSSLTSTLTLPAPSASTLNMDVTHPNVSPSTLPWNTIEVEPTTSTPNWLEANITASIKHISSSEHDTALTRLDINTDRNIVKETVYTSSLPSTQSMRYDTKYNFTTITVPSVNPNNSTYAASISFDKVPVIAGTVVGVVLLACIVMVCYILVKKRKRDEIKKRSQRFKGLKDNYEMIKMSPVLCIKPSTSPSKPKNEDSKPRKWSQPAENSNKINHAPRKFSDPGPQSKSDCNNKIALNPPLISPVKDQTLAVTNKMQSSMSKPALKHYEGTRESDPRANGIGSGVQPDTQAHIVNGDIETDGVNLHSYPVNCPPNTTQYPSSTIAQLKPGEGRSAAKQNSNRLNVDVLIAGLEHSINKKNNLIKRPGRRVVEKQHSDDGSGYSTISVMDAGNMTGFQNSCPEFIARDGEKLKAEDAESVYSTVMWEDVSDNTLPNFNFGSPEADDDGYTTVDSDSIGKAGNVLETQSSNDEHVSPSVEEPETGERSSLGGLYTTVDLKDEEGEVTPRLNRSKDRFNINQISPKQKLNNYSVIWPRHAQSDHLGSPSNKHKPVLFAGNTFSEIHPGASHSVYSTLHTEVRWHQNPYSTILDLKKQQHSKNGIESREKSSAGDLKPILTADSSKVTPAKRNYTLINIGSENGEGHVTSVKVTQIQQEKAKLAEQAKEEVVTPDKRLSDNSYNEKENIYFELERVTEHV